MSKRVGLTGGIGSGKSAVANLFQAKDVPVISADQVAREVTEIGTPALNEISEHFGAHVLNADGSLNRSQLGKLVFSNTQEREWLEKLLHPVIRQKMNRFADQVSSPYCVMEIPLLIETGQYQTMDRVLVVDCDKDIRIQRLIASRNLSREEVLDIMDKQIEDGERLAHADDVIDNSGMFENLEKQVDSLHLKYTQLFTAKNL